MKKVSVIIPNYNNGKYLKRCLNSVIEQEYANKEIIIIDDGSTDDSVSVARTFIAENKNSDIKLICQNNLNAAIARNRGIEVSNGDYVLFLDSDDLLENKALSSLVECKEREDVDLVIGNHTEINTRDKVVRNGRSVEFDIVMDAKKDFVRLIEMKPVPSNKLYDLKIIKANNLEWGNVRIGQDLNFYLKYLSLCKRVGLLNKNIYKYRLRPNSMSRTYDFRILDIVNVFMDVREFYLKRDMIELYSEYLPVLALRHYFGQLSKMIAYEDPRVRRLLVDYFSVSEKALDYSACLNCDEKFKKIHRKFRWKCSMKLIVTSRLYRKLRFKRKNF